MQGSQSVVRCINLLAHQHYYRMAQVKLVIQSSHLFGLISLASIRKKVRTADLSYPQEQYITMKGGL